MKRLKLSAKPRTIRRINRPGLYHVDRDFYHRDCVLRPSLSSSIAKWLLTGPPVLAWEQHPRLNRHFVEHTTPQAEIGTVTHSLVTGDTTRLRVIPYNDYRTEVAKRLRDTARMEGRIPILERQYLMLERAVGVLHRELERLKLSLLISLDQMLSEPVIVWQVGGSIWCRSRLDFLSRDVRDPMTVVDLKTTERHVPQDEVELGAFMHHNDWDLQAAAYSEAVMAITGVSRVRVIFLVLTLGDQPTVTVAPVGTMLREIGNRRWAKAVSIWSRCIASGVFPASSGSAVIAEAPGWLELKWLGEARTDNAHRMQSPEDEGI